MARETGRLNIEGEFDLSEEFKLEESRLDHWMAL